MATVITIFLTLAGCSAQIPLSKWSTPVPQANEPVGDIVSSGDRMEIQYFAEPGFHNDLYRLHIGDVLRIEVVDHPELTRDEVTVLYDGRASLPLVGSIMLGGLTLDEASSEVARVYRREGIKDPRAVVSVVRGEQRLASLAGTSQGASGSKVLLIPVFDNIPLDLPFIEPVPVGRRLSEIRREIQEKYDQVFHGQLDVVVNIQDRRERAIFVMGEVKLPGRVPITGAPDPVTALAAAGGLAESANGEQVVVLRRVGEDSMQRWIFSFTEALNEPQNPANRFRLRDNDVILVVRSGIADVNVWVDQYIRKNIPISIGIGIPID